MMDEQPTRPPLRVIAGGAAPRPARAHVPDQVVERAVVAVVATSGGLPRRMLTVMVQAWIELRRPGEDLPDPGRILRALGMCMVRGEVDARDQALVPGPAITERAG